MVMRSSPVQLAEEDRRLIRDLLVAVQGATAVLRGMLVALPRPQPRGDWGRPLAPAEGTRRGHGPDVHIAGIVGNPEATAESIQRAVERTGLVEAPPAMSGKRRRQMRSNESGGSKANARKLAATAKAPPAT